MEQVTVLPPGEWDPKIRLEPPTKVQNQVLYEKKKTFLTSVIFSIIVTAWINSW